MNQSIDRPVVRAFILHQGIDRQVKDEIVRDLMSKTPKSLRLKAQYAAKHRGINGLGKAGMLELWFRLGVVLNEVMEGKE